MTINKISTQRIKWTIILFQLMNNIKRTLLTVSTHFFEYNFLKRYEVSSLGDRHLQKGPFQLHLVRQPNRVHRYTCHKTSLLFFW